LESALQALREQVDDYLTKPFNLPKLVDSIEKKLQGRRLPTSSLLSTILRENVDKISSRILVNTKDNADMAALALSDDERLADNPRMSWNLLTI
jgi:DNA-binding NtrC family response regulator